MTLIFSSIGLGSVSPGRLGQSSDTWVEECGTPGAYNGSVEGGGGGFPSGVPADHEQPTRDDTLKSKRIVHLCI
jgi:hypothetical protein